ncbi:unnamed protein product [Urochloa decumbens]|uniref:NB-ARC domain-containing protein n=1 Tax=Urochloa decumbens TaxID=240449 RepID=A0ABC9AAZ9_9POAL
MEALVSAVLGDLISRSISFAVDRCCHRWSKGGGIDQDAPQRLRRLLLRVQVVVEEANRRRITNQSMLRQLQLMREGLYRGYYLFSAFKISHGVMRDNKPQDREATSHPSPSFALSRFNPAKRLRRSTVSDREAELQEVLARLERMASDMKELVVFLSCYPPLMNREPYSRHLWLENCLFGRQAEQDRIISFLLEPEAGPEHPGVLPVIGRPRVGKSTLVEHVCHDDRVRKHFSLIVFFSKCDAGDGKLLPLGDGGGVVKHRDLASSGKSLAVVELAGDVDENTWGRILCKLRGEYEVPVSKVVVTSRSDKIASFGTTQALELNLLPREAYWYYFKTIAFGSSTDAEEQPELADVCMEMAEVLDRSFLGAIQVGNLLRCNPCPHFWRRILGCFKEYNSMHLRLFGENPGDLIEKDRPVYLWTLLPKVDTALIGYRVYKVCSAQQRDDVPRVTADDLHTRSAKFQGKFEVLIWRSLIPPYYSYFMSCGVQASSSSLLCKPPRNRQIQQQQPRLKLM